MPSIIVFCAAALQACTGFGFSIMATPLLLLVYPAHSAIQINIILSIVISIIMVPRLIHQINRALLVRLLKGAIAGAPIGIMVFAFFDIGILKLLVSIAIIALTIVLIAQFSLHTTAKRDYFAGSLSAAFTTSMGLPGIPLLVYFSGARLDKVTLRSTTLTFFLFIYVVALLMQIATKSTTQEIWIDSLFLFPVTGLGILLGSVLFKHMSQRVFRILTHFILGATGLYLLYTSL